VRRAATFITGASGEIGHGLIERLATRHEGAIITLDLHPLHEEVAGRVDQHFVGSVLDTSLLERILAQYDIDRVFHLAALLSTRSEFTPAAAHAVNVEGTLRLLEFAQHEGESHGRPVVLLYPSSIAAYGLPDVETKERAGRVREDDWNVPTTMYGCNKLYCEHLGRYYAQHYKQLDAEPQVGRVDFRALRFPGLISAQTVPSGGTSDYAPEMIHAAAQEQPYDCFVGPDTRIPFMAMPDAVDAILALSTAPRQQLTQTVYNLTAFNPTADAIRSLVVQAFPRAQIGYAIDDKRQRILDSWPRRVDDSRARADWGLAPRYDLDAAFGEYLIPTIAGRYAVS